MTPEYQGLSYWRCDALTRLLSRMDADEDLTVLLREADERGVGGRFRSAIATYPMPIGYDLDEADRRCGFSVLPVVPSPAVGRTASGPVSIVDQDRRYPGRRPYRRTRDPTSRFTARQTQFLEMLAGGWTQPEIVRMTGRGRSNVASAVLHAKWRDNYHGPTEPWLAGLVADGSIRPFEKITEVRDAS